jgi:putative transcriptional regulator
MRKSDFEGLAQGLKEAVAHARGEDVSGIRVHVPAAIDIKAIRSRLGLTQGEFAERYGFTTARIKDWEQGRRVPDSGVRAYLVTIAAAPALIAVALRNTRVLISDREMMLEANDERRLELEPEERTKLLGEIEDLERLMRRQLAELEALKRRAETPQPA